MVPVSSAQPPQEVQQPQCAAAAMMHGISMAPASSLHGGCLPIQEHQEYLLPGAPPGMIPMQREVITPNPDYPIPANLWDLNIPYCAQAPSPLSTFHSSLQHDAESHTIHRMADWEQHNLQSSSVT